MLRRTSNGQLYRPRQTSSRSSDSTRLSSLDNIERNYGTGTRLYFEFLKFNIAANAVMTIINLTSWIVALTRTGTFGFFISAYKSPTNDVDWFVPNVILIATWAFIGPTYFLWERLMFKEDNLGFDDVIEENVNSEDCKPGIISGVFLTLICLGNSILLLWAFIRAQEYVSVTKTNNDAIAFDLTANSLMALCVSVVFSLMNMVWNYASIAITKDEMNSSWFIFRMSQALKLILFKVVLTTLLYTLSAIIIDPPSSCSFQQSGIQFFQIFVLDVVLGLVSQLLIPLIKRRLWPQKERPEFNLSENIFSTIFRQFIVNIGSIVFPLMSLMGLLSVSSQYFIDRYRLKRVCKDPHYIEEKPGWFLLGFSLLVVVASILTYPNGGLWVVFLPRLLPLSFQNCSMTGVINRI